MAFEVLKDICLNMNSAFKPYVTSFISLITPLISTIYSRKIRKLAIRSFEAIVYTCKTPEDQRQVFDLLLEKFLEKIKNDVKVGMIRDIKHVLKVFIHIFSEVNQGNVIQESSILSLYTILNEVISFVETKKQNVNDNIKNEDAYDENDKEGFDCDIEVLNEINRRVMELSGVLFKLYKEPLSDVVFNGLTGKFVNIFKNSIMTTRNEQEILYSLCFMNDLLSYSKITIFNSHYTLFIEYFTIKIY